MIFSPYLREVKRCAKIIDDCNEGIRPIEDMYTDAEKEKKFGIKPKVEIPKEEQTEQKIFKV